MFSWEIWPLCGTWQINTFLFSLPACVYGRKQLWWRHTRHILIVGISLVDRSATRGVNSQVHKIAGCVTHIYIYWLRYFKISLFSKYSHTPYNVHDHHYVPSLVRRLAVTNLQFSRPLVLMVHLCFHFYFLKSNLFSCISTFQGPKLVIWGCFTS